MVMQENGFRELRGHKQQTGIGGKRKANFFHVQKNLSILIAELREMRIREGQEFTKSHKKVTVLGIQVCRLSPTLKMPDGWVFIPKVVTFSGGHSAFSCQNLRFTSYPQGNQRLRCFLVPLVDVSGEANSTPPILLLNSRRSLPRLLHSQPCPLFWAWTEECLSLQLEPARYRL